AVHDPGRMRRERVSRQHAERRLRRRARQGGVLRLQREPDRPEPRPRLRAVRVRSASRHAHAGHPRDRLVLGRRGDALPTIVRLRHARRRVRAGRHVRRPGLVRRAPRLVRQRRRSRWKSGTREGAVRAHRTGPGSWRRPDRRRRREILRPANGESRPGVHQRARLRRHLRRWPGRGAGAMRVRRLSGRAVLCLPGFHPPVHLPDAAVWRRHHPGQRGMRSDVLPRSGVHLRELSLRPLDVRQRPAGSLRAVRSHGGPSRLRVRGRVFGHVHVHRGWLGVAGIPVGSRRELPSRLVALTVSAAVLAAACRKPAPVETIDLTAEFAHAEVCPVAGGRCAHGRRAAELLGIDARSAATIVNLPVGAGTNVYLRLPEASRVSLEFRAVDADVVVRATAAGGRPRVLGRATAADWRRIDVATAEPAGTIVQLAFAAEGHAGGGPGMVLVRNAIVMGRRTRTPAIVRRSSATPNVVLYVVDTLRADRLGCYGYPAPTSPRIDAFATSAIRFTQAVAQSSWTRSSTASILTGVVPPRHGALEAEHAIRPKLPTLPVLLQAGGYATAAFVVNPVVSGAFGFARGFDVFRMFPATAKRPEMFLPSDRLEHRLERWLAHAPRPFLMYVRVASCTRPPP